MANPASHFTDALIFIYDTNNELIAETVVTKHNRGEMYIEVEKGLEKVKPKTRLQLLILHSGGASELSGVFSIARHGVFEISIFGERPREVRASTRHTLNASAVVSDMVTDVEHKTLSSPIPVTVENLSTTGILVKSKSLRFEIGALLQIELAIRGKNAMIYGEVVREEMLSNGVYRYGCQLHFLD